MKILAFYLFVILGCSACIQIPLNTTKPDITDEYLSYTANGKDYFYKQVRSTELFAHYQTLEVFEHGPNGISIRAYLDGQVISKSLTMVAFEAADLNRDTFSLALHGGSFAANFYQFETEGDNYTVWPPYDGRLIFTKRNKDVVEGLFKFDAVSSSGFVIHVTQGKFSIKRFKTK